MRIHLAIDLGAESGRVIAVWIHGRSVQMHELHRFFHQPIELPSGLHWNLASIWAEMLKGLAAAAAWARDAGHEIASVGCDVWGVDWALVDPSGEVVALPHAYRDPRNRRFYEAALAELGVDRIYQATGIQLMDLNTLYSLLAFVRTSPRLVEAAERLLFIPDLLHYWLSGEQVVERTIASTSQMIDVRSGNWSRELLEPLGIPTRLLGPISPAGTVVGQLRGSVATATGLAPTVKVITPGSHDTASAVAAVPATGRQSWAYLSSGTWSLLGAELAASCTHAKAQAAMFTNEAGVGETIRFLKNISGLWLVQECRRAWLREGHEFSYQQLADLAAAEVGGRILVDPAFASFQTPGEMPQKIVEFARRTSQPVPESPGQFVRCCLDSLALAYRRTVNLLEGVLDRRFDVLHIVGGGGQNRLLNQLAADALERPVVVGPLEATAIGNGLVQAMACGELSSLAELRGLIAESDLIVGRYEPTAEAARHSSWERFEQLVK